jgi:hypothetical protein
MPPLYLFAVQYCYLSTEPRYCKGLRKFNSDLALRPKYQQTLSGILTEYGTVIRLLRKNMKEYLEYLAWH